MTTVHARWHPPGVAWAHATNSHSEITEALERAHAHEVHFIEADIILSESLRIPVMAHPPATDSDLSLEQFLFLTGDHNTKHPDRAVAIKLDFKDPDAVEPSLIILAASSHWRGTDAAHPPPVWLNADVLVGPGRRPTRFDPERFIRQCSVARPNDTLSLGWTVERGEIAEVRRGYEDNHIDEMIALCHRHRVERVSFAVHSLLAQQSGHEAVPRLLEHVPGSTLTFWGVADTTVHRFIESLPPHRTYRDTLTPSWYEWAALLFCRTVGWLR